MDISFALQALAAEELVARGDLAPGVHPVPDAHRPRGRGAEARVARRAIDELTPEQEQYRRGWRGLTAMDGLQASVEKMRREGLPDAAIDTFTHDYEQLAEGETGMLPESEIEPVEDVPEARRPARGGRRRSTQAVVIKLNGGLGTSMGMTRAEVADRGQGRADVPRGIARQVIELRERSGARLPLVLMDSFYTHDDALEALRATRSAPTWRPTSCSTRSRRSSSRTCSRSSGPTTRRWSGARPATATSTRRC